ncbi:MAG TPA: N-acetyl-gamma-glutamyl-phosphate reductase [Acidimicrobiales bacterium]|jgi:N-acetyl-gamma-glutamyl-phosphate reductase|nr:N-acetyl-gamma-glutamyl-phosphate reductase [Acidimicrobiales bacterium]
MGATGYAGTELLRLAASHPDLDVIVATGSSSVGKRVAEHTPALAAAYPTLMVESSERVFESDLDVVFLALPHGESQVFVPTLLERGVHVVDLGADFRLKDAEDYVRWYGHEHVAKDLLAGAVYGLVERHRKDLRGANLIAVPGCYPTASALALGPFCDEGMVERENIVVNALSGASGAGRATNDRLHFSRLAGNAEAYGLLTHRHTPEIQQEIGATLLFTPHLVPVSRGMLVSAYARVTSLSFTTDDALALLRSTYADDPFVVVTDEPPTLKDPLGSNLCFVSARVDERTGWLLAMSSLDNLTKGAAGQAVQAWNVATGRDETLGLPLVGLTP